MQWAETVFEKIAAKMSASALRTTGILPYTSVGGRYAGHKDGVNWWTNGFWAGLMWLLYARTNNALFRQTAEDAEELLDAAFLNYDNINHDLGFLWHLSAGTNYRLTGNPKSKLRATYAANLLMGRFNLAGRFIRAWQADENIGWSIIDAMMNLPLLYWAGEEYRDRRFHMVAQAHADMTLCDHLRTDGSARHIVVHDPVEGGVVGEIAGQGFALGSSWSRGQAWALYGFALSYRYTKNPEYLAASKRVAQYFITCACKDWLPRCDFRAPEEPAVYDSTAGAIAAAGLLELEGFADELEKPLYREAALSLLQAAEANWCNWDSGEDGILGMGTEMYHSAGGRHIHIIYGDFFFTDAVCKLLGAPPVW